MELGFRSDVETRRCLVWTTERPYWNKQRCSSTFSLMDAEWRLYLKIVTHRRHCSKTFNVVILKREIDPALKLEDSFRMTTFIENSFDYSFPSLGFTKVVRSGSAIIWLYEQEQVTKSMPLLIKDGRKWRIVCLIHSKSWSEPLFETIHLADYIGLNTAFIAPPTIEPVSDLENLSLDFSNLFMDEAFSDVKLRCGDRTIPAHRFVLAARSEVFADLLRRKMDETGVVAVKDLEPHVLELLLKYLYSGKVHDLSEDAALGLYAASDKHALHSLKKTCSDWMISNLTEENSARYFTIADAHNDFALKDVVTSFICNHEALLQSEGWLRLFKKPSGLAAWVYQKVMRAKRKKSNRIAGLTDNNK